MPSLFPSLSSSAWLWLLLVVLFPIVLYLAHRGFRYLRPVVKDWLRREAYEERKRRARHWDPVEPSPTPTDCPACGGVLEPATTAADRAVAVWFGGDPERFACRGLRTREEAEIAAAAVKGSTRPPRPILRGPCGWSGAAKDYGVTWR